MRTAATGNAEVGSLLIGDRSSFDAVPVQPWQGADGYYDRLATQADDPPNLILDQPRILLSSVTVWPR